MAITFVTSVNGDQGNAVTKIEGDDFKGYISMRPNGNRHVVVRGESLYMNGTSGTKVVAQAETVQSIVNNQAKTVANHIKMLRLDDMGGDDLKLFVNGPCPLT